MISISGDIDIPEAKLLIERYLGGWSSSERRPETPPFPGNRTVAIYFLTKDVPQSIAIFGWLAPAKGMPNSILLRFWTSSSGAGDSVPGFFRKFGPIWVSLQHGQFLQSKGDYGLFGAYALTKSASTVKVVSRIEEILREIGQKPVSTEELEGAKKAILNSFIFPSPLRRRSPLSN